jgi:hypothetical protein
MRSVGFALLPLLLSVGCSTETPTSPTGVAGSPAAEARTTHAGSGVVRSVTGTGHVTITLNEVDFWRNFAYTAIERADGSVAGQFEFQARQLSVRVHGRVTCLSVVGNAAWLGGVIEQMVGSFPNPAVGPGTPVWWRVVDNGQGANAVADLISGLGTMGDELAYCAARPAAPMFRPLEAGNIQVRG